MIKTRFAPNPDGALHLGSSEPIIFCDEYAKMYKGHFILRYEDTSSEVKPPIPEMYNAIQRDIEWLGVKIDEKYIQSDRLEIYYTYAEQLLREGNAYVCSCNPEEFRDLYMAMKACPCRDLDPETQLKRWFMMLDGTYQKGDAVVRIKTDLTHPNPAVRDWPALRISDVEHPRQGKRYKVWPLYNFSCGVDDHLMGVSHVIRGKEHDVNSIRQSWLQRHFGWRSPTVINVGRVGLEDSILSKSRMRAGIEDGTYWGWDDPRLGTLIALRRRGIRPETIRSLMIHIGPKPINVMISWDNLAAENRKIIEPISNRYYFIEDPIQLTVREIPTNLEAKLPLHPDHPERGTRNYRITPEAGEYSFVLSKSDAEALKVDDMIRLMGLMNIEITEVGNIVSGRYHSKDYMIAREAQSPFIHWLPKNSGINCEVVMPDARIALGLVEEYCKDLHVDEMIQFERFGFCRVDHLNPFVAYYSHK
jgi:glutamyl-tRNA synthetase